MAKLRKWTAYRTLERPYTRFSKQRKKGFVKSRPGKSVVKFDMGNLKKGAESFDITLKLLTKDKAQIRANAIEASRTAITRHLENKFGREGFYFKIKIVPHHALRENKAAAGAGADRLSTGMKFSFGKIIGTAARVFEGKSLLEISIPKEDEIWGRKTLKIASSKLPVRTRIELVENWKKREETKK
jgi:large subunit ribosomal protein L10e